IPPTFGDNYQAFKHDVQLLAGVKEVATARLPIYSKYYDSSIAPVPNSDETLTVNDMQVDEEFFSVLNVGWKHKPEGMDKLTGYNGVIINETAAAQLKLGPNPVGKKVKMWQTDKMVEGVVKDFTYQSMEEAIKPLAFLMLPKDVKGWGGSGGYAFVKVKPNTNMRSLLEGIKANFLNYDKEAPFEFTFLDEDFKAQYHAEDRLASIFT
ncbi:ABC transporter permease, partial [Massilia pinisoli]